MVTFTSIRRIMSLRMVASAALVVACSSGERANAESDVRETIARRELLRALENYQIASRMVDGDSIASRFTESGTLLEPGINPIVTRDSIRAFVKMFAGAKVHLAEATADTIEVFGTIAFIWGSYHEQLSFPGQPDSDQRGKFVAEWKKVGATWLVERMYRIPLPEPRK